MSEPPLRSLRQIAWELEIPESTARYYRQAFEDFIPCEGTGRTRKYPPEAVEVLGFVADAFRTGRSRADIAAALSGQAAPSNLPATTGNQMLRELLDSESERREAMWQMARELVRLGEAVERQQEVLEYLAGQAASGTNSLPPATRDGEDGRDGTPAENGEMAELRNLLEQERELVERLRQSKVALERRAAEAEQRLSRRVERSSVLSRILKKD